MYRNDDNTTVATLPAVPTDNIGTPGFFTGGSLAGQVATRVRYWWLNQIQEELLAILAAAGVAPVKASLNQVITSLKLLFVKQGSGVLQSANQVILGLSTQSTALRCTVDATDLGELAAFTNLAIGNWMEKYSTLAASGSETISLAFTAPRKGRVIVVGSANLASQASGNNLLSVACNGSTGSSDSVANTTSMTNTSCFEVTAGAVSVSSYFGISSSSSMAVGHSLSFLYVPE